MTAGTISGQLDLSAASQAKAHATASATARATMERELRDDRGRWFHGTSDVHAPGDIIDPAEPHRANFDPEHSEPKSVYIAGSVKHAMHYAERDKGGLGDPHVYEVEPTGEHWPIAPGSDQHQTKSPVRVIREVNTATEMSSPTLEGSAVHEHLGAPSLNKSQRDTLTRYQSALYHQMDAYLNTGDIHAADDEMGSHVISEPEMGKQVRHLDSIFKTIPPTTKPLVVYRGMTLPDATPGTVWTDKTPVSTSSDRATGEQYKGYAADADPGHAVLARITVPPGSKALSMRNQLPGDYSQAQQEAEVLLPRDS